MNKRKSAVLLIVVLTCAALAAVPVKWNPTNLPKAPESGPALCPGAYLTPEQGKATLDQALARFPNRAAWQAYVDHARKRIQEGANLSPWPRRTPLNPVVRARRTYDGYTVENVAFESVPGYFVTGNLYRPIKPKAPYPVVLAPHGHTVKINKPEDYDRHGRFAPDTQALGASLARMGAVVLTIDMFGHGDSIPQVGQEAHARPFSVTMHIWNATRALDYLLSLPGADRKRVAVSGPSGGGTQTFLLTALDSRVTMSIPVVMVSSHFFGGCQCESGLPIHRSADHFVNNAMIASMAAPRPMLVVSCGKDWTQIVPKTEFPFLRSVYQYYGVADRVENAHLPEEGHDYGPSKREAAYRFIAKRFGLPLAPVQTAEGKLDESHVTIEKSGPLHVFNDEFPVPEKALKDAGKIEQVLKSLQK